MAFRNFAILKPDIAFLVIHQENANFPLNVSLHTGRAPVCGASQLIDPGVHLAMLF